MRSLSWRDCRQALESSTLFLIAVTSASKALREVAVSCCFSISSPRSGLSRISPLPER